MSSLQTPKLLRVLVVDDESPARRRLTELIRQDSATTVIYEASNGSSALEQIHTCSPNLVFLDIQMPEFNGLEIVSKVSRMPLTIFVTAYDKHAIKAFEANALDYLLKPFSDERFEAALSRAKSRLFETEMSEMGETMLRALASRKPGDAYLDRLVVKGPGASHFVRLGEIESIEGAGVYVTLHLGKRELLHRATLNQLSAILNPARFVRVHRSVIVNIDSVTQLAPISHGEFELTLKSGRQVRVSRTYRTTLEKHLKQTL